MIAFSSFWFEIVFVTVLCLILGSFSSALIWRVPRGVSWIFAARDDLPGQINKDGAGPFSRSACPSCGQALKVRDLIPVFSWIFLKGRCHYCRQAIDVFYPAAEILTLLAGLGIYAGWGLSVPSVLIMMAMPFLVALMMIDFQYMILPNQLVAIMGGWGLAFLCAEPLMRGDPAAYILYPVLGQAILAALIYGGLSWLTGIAVSAVLRKDALGMGDVKFFAMAGLWLGLAYLPFFLICAGAAGIVIGLVYKSVMKKAIFPFGPALILSLYFSIILKGLSIVPFMPGGY